MPTLQPGGVGGRGKGEARCLQPLFKAAWDGCCLSQGLQELGPAPLALRKHVTQAAWAVFHDEKPQKGEKKARARPRRHAPRPPRSGAPIQDMNKVLFLQIQKEKSVCELKRTSNLEPDKGAVTSHPACQGGELL